jgi:hypothetical protein
MVVKCAECECTPTTCHREESSRSTTRCGACTKEEQCCCMAIHLIEDMDECCSDSSCTRFDVRFPGLNPQTKHTNGIQSPQREMGFGIRSFLLTAESVCILTAKTVDLISCQYSILLSVTLALLAGAFSMVAPTAYKRAK